MKRDLKLHHLELANLIKDVSVHAESTKDNLERVARKLNLRNKYKARIKPVQDYKIWQYEIDTLIHDLEYSSKNLTPVIAKISKLQKDCVRAADNLDNVILQIKTNLKNEIAKLGYNIAAKEKEYNAIGGCSFWSNLFSFGGCARAK